MTADEDELHRHLNAALDRPWAVAELHDVDQGGAAKRAALVEYRCTHRRGCLLLRVWAADEGVLFYQPRYKLSPERTEAETTPDARETRTMDGRRWYARGGSLDALRPWGQSAGLLLQCDHARLSRMVPEVVADADAATPGSPTRRRL